MKLYYLGFSGLFSASLLFSSTVIGADLCENLHGKRIAVDANGYEGTTWGVSLKKEQDGSFSFDDVMQMAGESADKVMGRCKDRHIVFTRKREGSFEQVYDGWIFEKGGYKMAGTFSHNGLRQWGWCGSILHPLPR